MQRSPFGKALRGAFIVPFIALRQLWARKLLNGIAIGGVALGVLVFITLSGILQGFHLKFTAAILNFSPHVIVYDTELHPEPPLLARYEGTPIVARVAHDSPRERQQRIKRPTEIVRTLASMKGVEAAAPSLQAMVIIAFGGKTKSIDLRGIDPAAQERVTPMARYVTAGSLASLAIFNEGIAVGSGIAEELGLHVGDVVHAASPGGQPLDLKVVAVVESEIPPIDRSRAYALLRNVQTLVGKPDTVGRIEVRLRDPEEAFGAARDIENMFGYDAESWKQTNANFLSIFALQNFISRFVTGAILLVGGFGILAIQIMIVLQKQRDIAILRAVGLRRADILWIFLVQGVVLALLGGLLGDALGRLSVVLLMRLDVHVEGIVKADHLFVTDEPVVYVTGLAFALAVGVTASLLPAWRGASLEPVEVLRGQIG